MHACMQSTAAVPTCRPQNAIEIALMMMSIFNLQTAETVWAEHRGQHQTRAVYACSHYVKASRPYWMLRW